LLLTAISFNYLTCLQDFSSLPSRMQNLGSFSCLNTSLERAFTWSGFPPFLFAGSHCNIRIVTITPAIISGTARMTVVTIILEMTMIICELMYRAVRNNITDFGFI
jgi:hypothetical protein